MQNQVTARRIESDKPALKINFMRYCMASGALTTAIVLLGLVDSIYTLVYCLLYSNIIMI